MKQINIIIILFFLFCLRLHSQPAPGCPQVDAGSDQSLDCSTNCTQLVANSLETGATSNYKVSSISYNPPFPFTGGNQIFINIDDEFTNTINLPFDFCFYGNQYSQCVIGTNGLITFDLSQANTTCEWAFNKSIPSPAQPGTLPSDSGIYNNSINGAFHDIDPSITSATPPPNINYAVLGSAPCRTFVVNFSTVAHYQCNNTDFLYPNLSTTQQIVLYETTNVIEVYIENKPSCTSWNYGNAVIGLQNQTGTQGVTPPGRNTGPWTASQEAWRFTPDGPSNYQVKWYDDSSNLVGTGDSLNVCPTDSSSYIARTEYYRCQADTIIVQDTVNVNVATNFSVSGTSIDASCTGPCDGSISATANGGTPPYQFNIGSGPQSNGNFQNLCGGNYAVTVSDDANCEDTLSYYIDSSSLTTVVDSTRSPYCAGDSNGLIKVSASGGSSPYDYSLNGNINSSGDFTNLPAGNYTIIATGANNCQDTLQVNLMPPNPLTLQVNHTDSIPCNGMANGTATANVTGGNGNYSYMWSNGDSSVIADSLPAGTHIVTVTDTLGCQAIDTFQITNSQSITIQETITDVSCFGLADGSIDISVTGGTSPYTYQWSNGNNSEDINNLTPGNYCVTVTDNNGCTQVACADITEPSPISLNTSKQDANCNQANGRASVIVNGGTPGYTYQWNDPSNQQSDTAFNLTPGNYKVVVTDSAGCQDSLTVTVGNNTASIAVTSISVVSCFGGSDGSATVSMNGGTPPFSYQWDDPDNQNTQTASGLSEGSYTVTVTDDAGCTVVDSVTIDQPQAPLTIDSTSTSSATCGNANGSAFIAVSGGTVDSTYSYQWNNGQTSAFANQLAEGSYTVTVTDDNGCTITNAFTIGNIPGPTLQTESTPVTCYGGTDGSATVTISGGTPPYQTEWSNGDQGETIDNVAADDYEAIVTDANNCQVSQTVTVGSPPAISVDAGPDQTIKLGEETTLSGTITGLTNVQTYSWQPQSDIDCDEGANVYQCLKPTVAPRDTTTYTLTAIDENNCQYQDTARVIVIIEPNVFAPNAFSPNNDEINDEFRLITRKVQDFKLQIYNRWGEKVFQSTDPDNGWDGTYKGQEMPPDTYVYVANLRYSNGKRDILKGSVTLIR